MSIVASVIFILEQKEARPLVFYKLTLFFSAKLGDGNPPGLGKQELGYPCKQAVTVF